MAYTYYVKTSGDDSKDGLSEANAFRTITKAVSVVSAGDTVYIAPGTYREVVSLLTSGNESNYITFEGDPDCNHFVNEKKGYVRITGCDSNEQPQATGRIFHFAGKNYNILRNVVVDGLKSGTGIIGVYLYANDICENCIVQGVSYGIYGAGTTRNCVAIAGSRAFAALTLAENCIGIGGIGGFDVCSLVKNCLGIGSGSYGGFSNSTVYNSIGIGYFGFNNCNCYNCISFVSYYGIRSTSDYTLNHHISVYCNYAFYGTDTAKPLNIEGQKYVYCYSVQRGGGYETGTPIECKHIGFVGDAITMIKRIASALKFTMFFEKDWSDDTVDVGLTDILGQVRRLGDGTIDVGAIEYSDKQPEWTTYKQTAPSIRINRKGLETFHITCVENIQKTIEVYVKFDLNGGTNKPQLIASGNYITTKTSEAVGDGTDWERLSVSFTPSKTGLVKIELFSRETTSGSYTIFSDLNVITRS